MHLHMRHPATVLLMLLLCLHVVQLRGRIKIQNLELSCCICDWGERRETLHQKEDIPECVSVSVCVRTEGLYAANQ